MTRGRRLLAQVLLLPVIYLLSLPDPALFTNVIFVIAMVTVPINATVAAILVWSSRQAPEMEVLREHADDSVTLFLMSLATAGTALVAVLVRLGFAIEGRPTLAILSWLAILIAVPAIAWLGTWRRIWLPQIRRRNGSPPNDDAGPRPGEHVVVQVDGLLVPKSSVTLAPVDEPDPDAVDSDDASPPARTDRST